MGWHRAEEPMPTEPKLPEEFEKIETSTSHESELTTLESRERLVNSDQSGPGMTWDGLGLEFQL